MLREENWTQVQKMLVLSTAHLTPETAAILNQHDKAKVTTYPSQPDLGDGRLNWGPQFTWDYGWMWWVDLHTFDLVQFPEEFKAIFQLANDQGCHWVRFDCDADKISGLPTWEW